MRGKRIKIAVGICAVLLLIVVGFLTTYKTKTYVNLLQEFTIKSENIQSVNTITAGAFLIHPQGSNLKNIETEADFYEGGGITFLPLRHIPGGEPIFDLFIQQEFIPKVIKNENKTGTKEPLKNDVIRGNEEETQEPYYPVRRQGDDEVDEVVRVFQRFHKFTTQHGYSAYRIDNTNGRTDVIINSPLAYWISAKPSALENITAVDSFAAIDNARATKEALIAATLNSFVERLKNKSYEKALNLTTKTYAENFSQEKLEIFSHLFERPFTSVDVLYNWNSATVQGVLEDIEDGKYAHVTAKLTRTLPWGNNWLISEYSMTPDIKGLPSVALKKATKDKGKAGEILGSGMPTGESDANRP